MALSPFCNSYSPFFHHFVTILIKDFLSVSAQWSVEGPPAARVLWAFKSDVFTLLCDILTLLCDIVFTSLLCTTSSHGTSYLYHSSVLLALSGWTVWHVSTEAERIKTVLSPSGSLPRATSHDQTVLQKNSNFRYFQIFKFSDFHIFKLSNCQNFQNFKFCQWLTAPRHQPWSDGSSVTMKYLSLQSRYRDDTLCQAGSYITLFQ